MIPKLYIRTLLTISLLFVHARAESAMDRPQSAPATAASGMINAYLPELERLKKKGDWAGLERLSRQALTPAQERFGSNSVDVASAETWLAEAIDAEGRYTEAESFIRHAIATRERLLGPDHPDTALSIYVLASVFWDQDRYAEAETLYRRSLSIRDSVLGPAHPDTAASMDGVALVLEYQGRYAESESLHRRALAIRQNVLGAEHVDTAESLNNLALVLKLEGRYAEAEPLYRQALAIWERALGPEHPNTGLGLNNLAHLLEAEGRYAEAELLVRRALAITEKTLGPEHRDAGLNLGNLALVLQDQGRYAEAERLDRRALEINEKALGLEHPDVAGDLWSLAKVLQAEGRHTEAEPLYRRALAIKEKALGPGHPAISAVLNDLASLLQADGRYGEAETVLRRSLAIDDETIGAEHPGTARTHELLGANEERRSAFGEATSDYRGACALRASRANSRDQAGEASKTTRTLSTDCSTRLSLSLWGYSGQGGGSAATDKPEALKQEAFVSTQRAAQSSAGDALSQSAALTAAASAGVGPQALAYEAALLERDGLDQRFAKAAGQAGEGGGQTLTALGQARADVIARIETLAATLKARAPRYWDYRSPEPIGIAALQARTGADSALLRGDEALIVFLVPPGQDKGLVFAVTKNRFAWAQITLTGDQLKARIGALRLGLERNRKAFDRQASFELYQALFGDPAVQATISDQAVLLIVPSGPLTSLPPGLLVTQSPVGGIAGDFDSPTLRSTPWLLRSKAIALLPAVSSLRTLRQLIPANRSAPTDPLLVFADPDFDGSAYDHERIAPTFGAAAPRSFASYFREGRVMADDLHSLPRLPGTRQEGEALETALGGRPGSLLLGSDASKAQLMARNVDGRLAQVKVLEFATHGLVAGDASWLAEPALVLAAGAKPEDELLLASEASTLKLNADWVLLSACNTASPDQPEAEGLSGLSRAFFFAGARSLLVSHWPVRDDIAARLVPSLLLTEKITPFLTHAEALRRASLAVLDDPKLDAASPSAWAPFSLIGEAGR